MKVKSIYHLNQIHKIVSDTHEFYCEALKKIEGLSSYKQVKILEALDLHGGLCSYWEKKHGGVMLNFYYTSYSWRALVELKKIYEEKYKQGDLIFTNVDCFMAPFPRNWSYFPDGCLVARINYLALLANILKKKIEEDNRIIIPFQKQKNVFY